MKTIAVLCCLGLVAVMGCGSDNNSGPQSKTFTVTMTSANEIPACANPNPGAAGTATVTIPADNSSVSVSATFSGLSGAVTAGHIHAGTSATSGGPVVLPFSGTLTSGFSVTLTAADFQPAPAAGAPDFATFVAALKAGGAGYVNLHTSACPGGEIRGEVQ